MDTRDIQNLIEDLLRKTQVNSPKIEIEEENGTNTWFKVEVEEPGFFTERDGEALHALNHIVRRLVEARSPEQRDGKEKGIAAKILIDINGFQKKRVENTRAVAHMMGERARYFKSNVEVDPMSSFERRIVHEFLADALDLKTESVGFGRGRRVVIKYIGTI